MPLNNKYQYNDRSGNYYHGINNGTNLIGEAGDFDGVDDYIYTGTIDIGLINTVSI